MNEADVLRWWEQGRTLPRLQRALWYLQQQYPQQSWECLLELPIGERDRRLFALRRQLFGPSLHVFTTCPHCRLELEFSFDSEPLCGPNAEDLTASFDLEGAEVRLLNTADQLTISRMSEAQVIPYIMKNCLHIRDDRHLLELDGVIGAMLKQDPLAEILLQLKCEQCGHEWPLLLDVVSFFQRELDDYATSLLQQVHILASAYGWTEQEILSLSPERRHTYMEMLAA
jgi:hypothetical protein